MQSNYNILKKLSIRFLIFISKYQLHQLKIISLCYYLYFQTEDWHWTNSSSTRRKLFLTVLMSSIKLRSTSMLLIRQSRRDLMSKCPTSGENTRRGTPESMLLMKQETSKPTMVSTWMMTNGQCWHLTSAALRKHSKGKKDAFKNIFIRTKEDLNIVRVCKAEWYLNGKMITNPASGHEFFSWEKSWTECNV